MMNQDMYNLGYSDGYFGDECRYPEDGAYTFGYRIGDRERLEDRQ